MVCGTALFGPEPPIVTWGFIEDVLEDPPEPDVALVTELVLADFGAAAAGAAGAV